MKIFNIFKNRIIKDTISILFIFLFLFENIAPLTINAYSNPIESKKNYSQKIYPQENEFSFYLRSKYYSGYVKEEIDKIENAQFYPIELPIYNPRFLIGIVEVTNDNDPISKEIGRDVFLGMRQDEIINEINNKYRNRIWNYNEKNVYNYSIENQNIIVNLDSMVVDRTAKGGIAVILEVENLPMMNNTLVINKAFDLRSICINDNSENLGIICINDKYYSLPNSIELLKNKNYRIEYKPDEGYEFDHWKIRGGKLAYKNNESNNILYVQDDFGEIVAFYRKIGETTITTTSSTSILTTSTSTATTLLSSSSIRTTQTSKTQSLTSYKEIKTTSSISTTTSIKQEENFVDKYIITPIKEYIINPIIKYIIEPINEYIIKPFVKYIIEPILKYVIQPFIEYIIKPIIEIIIKIIEIIKNIIKIILDIFNRIIDIITGKSEEKYTETKSFTSYSIKYKTYEKTKSIEEKSTYKEYSISYEKTKYDSTKIIISYETKINTIYITKTIKTIGNKEIITNYPIITTIYEIPYITTTTSSITSYKQESTSSISTTIPKKITTIYEKTSTIKNTEEPITYEKTTTITTSSLTTTTSTSTRFTSYYETKRRIVYRNTSTKASTKSTTTSVKVTIPSSTRTTTSYKTSYTTTNIIYTTTISNYKYVTTKTITTTTTFPIKTETIYVTITGFTTTYRTPIYTYTTIVTNTKSSSEFYGGGGGGRGGPLLRDSLLSYPRIYKEFLKKKEENRKLPLLYLVYKVTPLRVKQCENYYNKMTIYKINTRVKNYDNKERKCILSIGRIDKWPLGFFLSKPNVPYSGYPLNSILENEKYSKEIKIDNKIEIDLKANEKENEEYQIFFEEDIDSPYLFLYVFHNDLTLVDIEPNFNEMVYTSLFWSGFWDAMKNRAPGIIVSSGLILAISLTGGTAQAALVTTAFLLKLQSATIEVKNIYEVCENVNSLLDIANIYEDIGNIARGKGYNAVAEYLKDEADTTRGKIFEAAMGLGLDLLLNVNYNNLKIALGIEKARSDYEKGYATGDVVASIINVASFVAIAASIKKLNENLDNKISLWSAVKDSLKAWLSPNIMDFAVMMKGSVKNIASIEYSSKVNDILEGIAAAGLLSSKSEKARDRVKVDLEPLIKDLTEDKIIKDLSLLNPVEKKAYQFYSLANEIIEIAGKREGEYNKDFIKGISGELFKLAGDVYGKSGSIEFTIDTFKALNNVPKESGLSDPVEVVKDYLSNDKNLEIIKKGWRILKGGEDYKKLFRSFIGWETSLSSYEKRTKLNNILNNYIDSGRQSKVLLLSNTFDWTYELRKSITPYDMRYILFDHMTEFLDYWNLECIKSLDDNTLGKINSIINNFRNVYNLRDVNDVKLAYKRFLHLDNLLYKYTLVEKEGNIGIDWDLFNDWVGKALEASSNKNYFVIFMNTETREGGIRYCTYISTEVAGKDTVFFGLKVPIKIGGNELNGYIPLIRSADGATSIPYKVASFLINTGYVPKEKGFIIISTDTSNGKIFAPVMVERRCEIDILKWTKKALSISQYSKDVNLKEGELDVNWDDLIEKKVFLKATIAKPDGTIVATRYVVFRPDRERIRIYIGKGVSPHDTVIVIFEFTNVKDSSLQKIFEVYGEVMKLKEEEARKIDENTKGLYGEFRHCQVILENTPEGTIKDVRARYKNGKETEIDIVTTKHLIEVKKWDSKDTVEIEIKSGKLIDQLKEYRDIAMNKEIGKKVVLSFYKKLNEISEDCYNEVIKAIENAFGKDWNNWLTICNGIYEFESFIINEYS